MFDQLLLMSTIYLNNKILLRRRRLRERIAVGASCSFTQFNNYIKMRAGRVGIFVTADYSLKHAHTYVYVCKCKL